MNEVVLRLFFHGLIAFVPSGSDGMEAYLLKHEHYPHLIYEMTRNSTCPEAACSKLEVASEPGNSSDWCICYLGGGIKISFHPQTMGPTRPIDGKPDKIKPNTKTQSSDFSWLVRMANIQDGNPVYIKQFKDIRSLVSARLSFKWLSERSCHLDQISTCECEEEAMENCKFMVHPFRFVGVCGMAGHRQALSEYAAFDLRFPHRPVKLTLEEDKADGSPGEQVVIDLGCEPGECPDVLIANFSDIQGCPEPDSPDVGEHFLAYYDLVQNPERLKMLFPARLVEADSLSVEDDQLFTCFNDPLRKLKDLARKQSASPNLAFISTTSRMAFVGRVISLIRRAAQTRIICPMAMFDQQQGGV